MYQIDELDAIVQEVGGDLLAGSGFEHEVADPDFSEVAESQEPTRR